MKNDYDVSVSILFDVAAKSEEEARQKVEKLLLPLEKKNGYIDSIEVFLDKDEE